ncbi:MAG: hypothetical protein HGA54_07645, partial [Actinobacteria bacterium]|nr:hypothetical protein [Actinomycetota bacterium]
MKLSFRFFHTKITHLHPGASMVLTGDEMPMFSTLGIISDDAEVSDEIIYIDVFPRSEDFPPVHASVITTESRAGFFKECNLVVLPDGSDLVKITQLVSRTFTYYFGWSDALYEAIAKNNDLQV